MPRLHPFAADSFPAIELRATAAFSAGGLNLSFVLCGDQAAFAQLVVPSPTVPDAAGERRNHLWQSTCLECFVADTRTPGYFEINLSPAHHWNVYHFSNYRQGMTAPPVPPPTLHAWRDDGLYRLDALFTGLPLVADPAHWRLGLSAVLAGTDGEKGYFALVHPGVQPDFHHPNGFVFRLSR